MSCNKIQVSFDYYPDVVLYLLDECNFVSGPYEYAIRHNKSNWIILEVSSDGQNLNPQSRAAIIDVDTDQDHSPSFGSSYNLFSGFKHNKHYNYGIQNGCIDTNIGYQCAKGDPV